MTFEAFWLPGLRNPPTRPLTGGAADGEDARVRIPDLGSEHIREQVVALIAAGARLRDVPIAVIVSAVDRVARRLLDPGDVVRRQAEELIIRRTGYSEPMTRLVLDRMVSDWRADRLELLLAAEIGNAEALDTLRRCRDVRDDRTPWGRRSRCTSSAATFPAWR